MAILAFAAVAARDLPATWLHSPYDRLGWLAFLLWLTPLVARIFPGGGRVREDPSLGVAIAGLVLVVFGMMGALNAAKHAGLALAFAAFLPAPQRWTWLVASVAWMPSLGWLASHGAGETTTVVFRLVFAAAGAAGAWVLPKRETA
jgi:hypothetical protein